MENNNMPTKEKGGRQPVPLIDLILAALLSTLFNLPSRRATSYPPTFNAVPLFVRRRPPSAIRLRLFWKEERLRKHLRSAIDTSADCVRNIEKTFAFDSTYFKMPLSEIHIQRRAKGAMPLLKIKNRKLHIAVGAETLVIVGCATSDADAHDVVHFIPVLEQFCRRFTIDAVLADAAYSSQEAYDAVEACGGLAFLDFKKGAKPKGSALYDEMLDLYDRREEDPRWYEGYRFRPLVETTNSLLKRTIKRILRSRLEETAHNELLAMILVHNLKRLIVARIEHNIQIPWADSETLQRIDTIGQGKKAA